SYSAALPSRGSPFPFRSLLPLQSAKFLSRFVSIPDDFSAFLPEAERRGFLAVKEQAHFLIGKSRPHQPVDGFIRNREFRERGEFPFGTPGGFAQFNPFVVKCMGFSAKLAKPGDLRHIA